jgi:uncharacterized membrane protein YeaQ/YmgE (transglycosylase-associated protein family)
MSLLGLLILLVIAALAGAIGQAIAGFSRGGCLASIGIGFIGAFIGMWLAQTFNLPTFFVINVEGEPFPLIWAIIGGALFAGLLSLLFGPRYRVRRRA